MKNIKLFEDFVNEGKFDPYEGESVAELYGNDKNTDSVYDACADALGCDADELYQVHTEMDDTDGYDACESAFQKGPSKNIKIKGATVGGPFLKVNAKTGVCEYNDYGFNSYIYNPSNIKY